MHIKKVFGIKNKEFLKKKTYLGVSARTYLYLSVVIMACFSFTMKMQELSSAELVKTQLALLDLRVKGFL